MRPASYKSTSRKYRNNVQQATLCSTPVGIEDPTSLRATLLFVEGVFSIISEYRVRLQCFIYFITSARSSVLGAVALSLLSGSVEQVFISKGDGFRPTKCRGARAAEICTPYTTVCKRRRTAAERKPETEFQTRSKTGIFCTRIVLMAVKVNTDNTLGPEQGDETGVSVRTPDVALSRFVSRNILANKLLVQRPRHSRTHDIWIYLNNQSPDVLYTSLVEYSLLLQQSFLCSSPGWAARATNFQRRVQERNLYASIHTEKSAIDRGVATTSSRTARPRERRYRVLCHQSRPPRPC